MKIAKLLPMALVVGATALSAQPAFAVDFGFTADYFSVTRPANPNTASDFKPTGYSGPYGTYANMVQSSLSGGIPVYNTTYGGPTLVNLLSGNRLAWWTPGTYGGTIVSQTGDDVAITLPFNDSTFFVPNGTGTNDGSAYLTAIFTSTFTLDTASILNFSLGADDDVLLFVDGTSLLQLGGIHDVTPTEVASDALGAGNHIIQLFYADRNHTNAALNFNVSAAAVPEPATWAMMIGGLALVGLSMRRRKTAVNFA